MKSSLTFLFLFTVICSSIGQSNNSFDVLLGIDRSYRDIRINTDAVSFNSEILDYHEDDSPKMNWRVGANYKRVLSKHTYLKAGLRLASVGYQALEETDLQSGMAVQDPTLPNERSLFFDFLFIETPLTFGLSTRKDKFSFFVEAGLASNIYLTFHRQEVTDIGANRSISRISGVNNLMLSVVGAFGVEYHLNENFSVFAQPSYRYFIAPISDLPGGSFHDTGIKEYLFSYGIEFGVRKNIGIDKN